MAEDKPDDLEQSLKEAEAAAAAYEEGLKTDPDRAEQEKIEAEFRVRCIKFRSDLQQILKIVEVRRTFWRLLEIADPYAATFVPGASDVSAFNQGKQDIGRKMLFMLMDADPGVYYQMQREHLSDLKAEAERRKRELKEK